MIVVVEEEEVNASDEAKGWTIKSPVWQEVEMVPDHCATTQLCGKYRFPVPSPN